LRLGSDLRPRAIAGLLGLAAWAAFGIFFPGHAEAKRHFVPREFPTIQRAIDSARAGDTLWVSAGVYRESLVVTKPLILFSDQGPEKTILDGGDSVRVLRIEGVRGAAVIGFTIRGGRSNAGGGIQCVRDTSVMIASSVFRKNWESAVSCWQSQDVNFLEDEFVENEGSAVALDASSGVFGRCTFEKNRGYAGGAISLRGSRTSLPIRDSRFRENEAENATGGAIFADSSEVIVGQCQFEGNSAKVAGGAIAAMDGSRLAVGRTRFLRNHSAASGALHSDHSVLNVAYSIFDRNEASALAGAVGLVGLGMANVHPIVDNNTFYKNVSKSEGTTIWAERASPEIKENIFVLDHDQKAFQGLFSSPFYECNLLHDPSGAALGSLPSVDTLVGDPLFCDPEHGDFTVRDLSPAILARCGPIGAEPKKCTSFRMVPKQ
jgi:predicted outer membrane repeat protein